MIACDFDIVEVQEWCEDCSEQYTEVVLLKDGNIFGWYCYSCGEKNKVRLEAQSETSAG